MAESEVSCRGVPSLRIDCCAQAGQLACCWPAGLSLHWGETPLDVVYAVAGPCTLMVVFFRRCEDVARTMWFVVVST